MSDSKWSLTNKAQAQTSLYFYTNSVKRVNKHRLIARIKPVILNVTIRTVHFFLQIKHRYL